MNSKYTFLIIVKILILFSCLCAQTIQTDKPTVKYKLITDILYYPNEKAESDEYIKERCRLDLYYPQNMNSFPAIVWFHGGGLRAGERYIPEQLKNKQMAVVAVNYRLFPEVKSPKYIEDAAASVAWVINNIQKYGGNPELIFVSGHSAGGYLTSMIGLDKKYLKAHELDADMIAGLIPFSGHAITHFTVREERGIKGEIPVIDDLAPLFHIREDAPPLVLITGDRDLELLGRYEENAYLERMMKVIGHKKTSLYEVQGFDHGSMVNPGLTIMLKFINNHLNNLKSEN